MIESGPAQSRLHNMSAPPRMRLTLRALVGRQARPSLFGLFGGGDGTPDVINGLRCIGCGGFPASRSGGLSPVVTVYEVLGERETGSGDWEETSDHLLTLLGRLDPAALGLPPFALAVTLTKPGQPAPWTAPALSGKQVLALLSRTAGGVFLAGRRPRLAFGEWVACRHAWFVPHAGGRS